MAWTLVTGGAKRLGAEICLGLAKKGYDVIVHYHTSAAEAAHVVEACRRSGVKAEKISGDFSSTASTERFAAECLHRFPDIANLINNVGSYQLETILQTSAVQWDTLFQTNLHAPFTLIKALAPSLIRAQGSIINIGVAGIGHVRSQAKAGPYGIAKAGLWMLTKTLARELAPEQVRVNMVSPGMLDISIDLDAVALPMSRPGTTEEVTNAILFLLEPANRYITGQNIEVAGGYAL